MPMRAISHAQRRGGFRHHDDRSIVNGSKPYDGRWQRNRRMYLREHPVCKVCAESGVTRGASVVDHIVPHKGNMELFNDESNWQSLCKACHDHKTQSEGAFGR